MTKKFYFDMDGVLANWVDQFEEGGRPLSDFKGDSQALWDYFIQRFDGGEGFYRRIKPFDGAVKFFHEVKFLAESNGYEVEFLTALIKLAHVRTVQEEKVAWIIEHLIESPIVNIGPLSEDKHNWARPGDILLDDRKINIEQWNAAGGIGILHTDFETSLIKIKKALLQ